MPQRTLSKETLDELCAHEDVMCPEANPDFAIAAGEERADAELGFEPMAYSLDVSVGAEGELVVKLRDNVGTIPKPVRTMLTPKPVSEAIKAEEIAVFPLC